MKTDLCSQFYNTLIIDNFSKFWQLVVSTFIKRGEAVVNADVILGQ